MNKHLKEDLIIFAIGAVIMTIMSASLIYLVDNL